ncbi:hypothetical protein C8R43DRAFT_1030525 [Mycena crocata]|nr:hypothetical protein C8R43DRAFT_1030525 [Mycena crocata]
MPVGRKAAAMRIGVCVPKSGEFARANYPRTQAAHPAKEAFWQRRQQRAMSGARYMLDEPSTHEIWHVAQDRRARAPTPPPITAGGGIYASSVWLGDGSGTLLPSGSRARGPAHEKVYIKRRSRAPTTPLTAMQAWGYPPPGLRKAGEAVRRMRVIAWLPGLVLSSRLQDTQRAFEARGLRGEWRAMARKGTGAAGYEGK